MTKRKWKLGCAFRFLLLTLGMNNKLQDSWQMLITTKFCINRNIQMYETIDESDKQLHIKKKIPMKTFIAQSHTMP